MTADTPAKHKPSSKLGAEKLMPEEPKRRLIEAARDTAASEDESVFGRALGKLIKCKPAGAA